MRNCMRLELGPLRLGKLLLEGRLIRSTPAIHLRVRHLGGQKVSHQYRPCIILGGRNWLGPEVTPFLPAWNDAHFTNSTCMRRIIVWTKLAYPSSCQTITPPLSIDHRNYRREALIYR